MKSVEPTRSNKNIELDLFELWGALLEKRNVVLVVFSVAMLLSLAKVYFSVPVYQVTIHFLPPATIDIARLNVDGGSNRYTVDKVYNIFLDNFRRRDNLWRFFSERRLYAAYLAGDSYSEADINRSFENDFLAAVHMENSDFPYIEVALSWGNAEEAAALLNEYSQFVLNVASKELVMEVKQAQELKIKNIENDISALRNVSIELKQWQLEVLEENISIAKGLGLKRSIVFADDHDPTLKSSPSQFAYLLGFEVLEIEKEALLKRKNNDPFTRGLDDLIKKRAALSAQTMPNENIRVALISQAARLNPVPVEPKKKIIVMLGAGFGLLIGVFLALLSFAINRRREQ